MGLLFRFGFLACLNGEHDCILHTHREIFPEYFVSSHYAVANTYSMKTEGSSLQV
jgi:hypothetical protein